MSFKIPIGFKKKPKPKQTSDLPSFEESELQDIKEVGRGSYGVVYKATKFGDPVILKRNLVTEQDENDLVLKEATLLCSHRHENIVKFIAFNEQSCTMLLELMEFNFEVLDIERDPANNLRQLMRTCDELCDYENFEHLQCFVMKDVISGMRFLHSRNVVHRDLKPENILVSNSHFIGTGSSIEDLWNSCPVVTKLTDFGEARSDLIQTFRLSQNTRNLNRGTPAYMAPESLLQTLQSANLEDLKRMDIWSLGMIAHALINPNSKHPYWMEIRDLSDKRQSLERLLMEKKRPCSLPKYESTRLKYWNPVDEVFQACSVFEYENRPGIDDVQLIFNKRMAAKDEPTSNSATDEYRGTEHEISSNHPGREKAWLTSDELIPESDTRLSKEDHYRTSSTRHIPDGQFILESKRPSEPSVDEEIKSFCRSLQPMKDQAEPSVDEEIKSFCRSLQTMKDQAEPSDILINPVTTQADTKPQTGQKTRLGLFDMFAGGVNHSENARRPEQQKMMHLSEESTGRPSLSSASNSSSHTVSDDNLSLSNHRPKRGSVSNESQTDCRMPSPREEVHVSVKKMRRSSLSLVSSKSSHTDSDESLDHSVHRPRGRSVGNECQTDCRMHSPGEEIKSSPRKKTKGKRCVPNERNGNEDKPCCSQSQMDEVEDCQLYQTDMQLDECDHIVADFHQGSWEIFDHEARGAQCSTISLMAIVAGQIKLPTSWTKHDIHRVLIQGDKEHVKQLQKYGWPETRAEVKLDVDEIPDLLTCRMGLKKETASVGVMEDSTYGLTSELFDMIIAAIHNKPSHSFLLRMADKCVSIIKGPGNSYSILDSHSCDISGLPVPNGAALLRHFLTKYHLARHIESLTKGMADVQHDLTPVNVALLGKDNPMIAERDLSNVKDDALAATGYSGNGIGRNSGINKTRGEDNRDSTVSYGDIRNSNYTRSYSTSSGDSNFSEFPLSSDTSYNQDKDLPVFESERNARYPVSEASEILLYAKKERCLKVPLMVKRDLAFLIDVTSLNDVNDVKSDMNGTFLHVLRIAIFTIELTESENEPLIQVLHRKRMPLKSDSQYHLFINSKRNDHGLSRSIFHLVDKKGEIVRNLCLLQYTTENGRAEFKVPPHGNRRHGSVPFYPMQKSTLKDLKSKVSSGLPPSSVYCDAVHKSSDGILGARNPGQMPRSRHQLYMMKETNDEISDLLQYSQHQEEGNLVLHHSDVPDDLWVLGRKYMLTDLSRFCTSDIYSYPFSIDPTYNFGKFEVTPVTYRHLLLKNKRTGVAPIFLGPTTLHHRKDDMTYRRMVTGLTTSCPEFTYGSKGFITDGEAALQTALKNGLPNATSLRCCRHFYGNCKDKLNQLGIRGRREQCFFLTNVFGCPGEKGLMTGGIVDAADGEELQGLLDDLEEPFNQEEKKLLEKPDGYSSKFFRYLKNRESIIGDYMTEDKREKAGMPYNDKGHRHRPTTNQSESMNNKLTRQKEAVTGKSKEKTALSKLTFVRSVWEEVEKKQQDQTKLAVCGMGEEFVLSDDADYLRVDPEVWFSWNKQQRQEYMSKFNKLSMSEVMGRKNIPYPIGGLEEKGNEVRQFSIDIRAAFTQGAFSTDQIMGLVKEAEQLLNSNDVIQKMPVVNNSGRIKFLVASTYSKNCKKGLYECVVYKDHVTCSCQSYKFNCLCKHSICVAEEMKMVKSHVTHLIKTRGSKRQNRGALTVPSKETSGKKGGRNKNPWRPERTPQEVEHIGLPSRPYTEIHHNDLPLTVCFLNEMPKAMECRQCHNVFPRCKSIIPYDIILSHQERWMYKNPDDTKEMLASPHGRLSTKFYCVKKECIFTRFPYFDPSYLEVPAEIKARLGILHFKLLQHEFRYEK